MEIKDTLIMTKVHHIDLTTDETHVLVVGDLENGTTVRLPIYVSAAVKLSILLGKMCADKG